MQKGAPRATNVALAPRGDAPLPLVFHRGAHAPYATRWFGVTSLAGHARNLVASAIAAESIDSRDWMRPARAERLLSHVVHVLGGDSSKASVVEALGRPLWVDFVADTGDDHDVSQAVARMLFATYSTVVDGTTRILPRGDVLLFGGDTAYPVATAEEIARRLVVPWNDVLRERALDEDRRRVLLGIPGDHDWYDGLDGFGRLFRRNPHGPPSEDEEPRSALGRRRVKRETGIVARQLHLDEVGGILRMLAGAWRGLRALVAGEKSVVRGDSRCPGTTRCRTRRTGRCLWRRASRCGAWTGSSVGSTTGSGFSSRTDGARSRRADCSSSRPIRRSRSARSTHQGSGCCPRAGCRWSAMPSST